ncbi:MAG: alanine racemase [Lentisphaerae bacterium]|nr:alanine racemase [Lentisphaerota bacterium]
MADSRVVYRIDLAQLKENFRFIMSCAHDCKLMPVLKYDAYGMGAQEIGAALKSAGAYRFAAATVDEALDLKKLQLDVQILGLLPPWEVAPAVAADIICPADNLETAKMISAEAVKQQKSVRVAIKLDTGMGRLGIQENAALETISEIVKLPGLVPDSLFSHFCTAAQPDIFFADLQLERFLRIKTALDKAGIKFAHYHHAAGDAIVKIPRATMAPFNLARPGGMMYGDNFTDPCRQIVELTTYVGEVRNLPAGASVGYYRTCILPQPRKVAVLAAGYADGIPLALSNRGKVIIHGEYCPILGRISMDYTIVDVSHLPQVRTGDEAVLLGKRGEAEITVGQWGKMKGTHGHEIWCAMGHRKKTEYIRD